MTLPFEGKLIVVTGAASGIGRATAIALSKLGATLALTDINSPGLRETISLCTSPNQHTTSTFDISSSSFVNDFIRTLISDLSNSKFGGKIDHVFNCAGINPTALATSDITDEYYEKMMGTNMKGLFNMTRACTPFMREPAGNEKASSSFVNVSSICGTSARPGFAVYCATKFGIIGFSKCMALELGPRGVRTNVIAPGYINTPTNAGVVAGDESVKAMVKGVSIGRIGNVEDVADVVVFLMGDGARYMNGSVVDIDGGIGRGGF